MSVSAGVNFFIPYSVFLPRRFSIWITFTWFVWWAGGSTYWDSNSSSFGEKLETAHFETEILQDPILASSMSLSGLESTPAFTDSDRGLCWFSKGSYENSESSARLKMPLGRTSKTRRWTLSPCCACRVTWQQMFAPYPSKYHALFWLSLESHYWRWQAMPPPNMPLSHKALEKAKGTWKRADSRRLDVF